MPTPSEILAGLGGIAERWWFVALAFHIAIGAAAIAVWRGWRPSALVVSRLLLLPLISVAAFAAAARNPFNAAVFAALVLGLAWTTRSMPRRPVHPAAGWRGAAGLLFIAFGLVYPHFLESRSVVAYLYAAPTGLVPCPSLSLVVGFTLLLAGAGWRSWSIVLTAAALFYGLFGLFVLRVWIDAFLLAGAAALSTTLVRPRLEGRSDRWKNISDPDRSRQERPPWVKKTVATCRNPRAADV